MNTEKFMLCPCVFSMYHYGLTMRRKRFQSTDRVNLPINIPFIVFLLWLLILLFSGYFRRWIPPTEQDIHSFANEFLMVIKNQGLDQTQDFFAPPDALCPIRGTGHKPERAEEQAAVLQELIEPFGTPVTWEFTSTEMEFFSTRGSGVYLGEVAVTLNMRTGTQAEILIQLASRNNWTTDQFWICKISWPEES